MDDEQVFRPAFLPIFFAVFLAGAVCCAVLTVILDFADYRLPGVISYTYLRILAIVYLWAMVCAVLIVWVLSVRVSSAGIRGRTFWGTACAIDWQDMKSAVPTGFPGFRFLRLYAFQGGAPMWVPLFLRKRDEFRARVLSSVSDSHPIREAVAA